MAYSLEQGIAEKRPLGELILNDENPTPGNEGASIEDRLTAYLSAQEPTAQDKPEPTPQAEVKADSAEKASVQPDGDGEEQDAGPQISTTDLAKFLGIDEAALDLDEDGTVKLKTKVDGQEGAAKLADLLKSYQLQEHVDRKARDAAEREKALQARQQEAEQQFTQRLQYAENLANVASQQLMAEFQSVDWKSLEQQDPGTAALLRQKFQERQAQLMGVFQNIQQNKAQEAEQKKQTLQQRAERELQRVSELVPDWQKADVYLKESAEIRDLANKRGVSKEVLAAITGGEQFDAGLISLVRDALLYSKMQQSKPEIENKVRNAPKLVKPGQAQQQSAQENSLRNLKAQVTKTGGKNGSLEAFLIAAGLA